MKILKLVNPERVSEEEAATYSVRRAARAIVYDGDNKIALFHSTKFNYYKLPGGGIEGDETSEEAAIRECKEEIGCDVELISELGEIIEYRKKFRIKQFSYCYIGRLKGAKGNADMEQDEIDEGFETVWLTLGGAMNVLRPEHSAEKYEIQYITARDSAFLHEAST
jgi:8-oxo-dGTP diphosphatase